MRNATDLPWWVGGSPLQVILHWWLRLQGMQLTHAASVGNQKHAVLLTGEGGSGKSTTTLSCLQDGLSYIAEDYCVVEPAQSMVYSIYESAKIEKRTREFFPEYESFIANPEEAKQEKALMFYGEIFEKQMKRALPIKAIVALRLGHNEKPVLKDYDKKNILKDLLWSTVKQLPIYHQESFRILNALSEKMPGHQLFLGYDRQANVNVIRELLES